MFHTRGKYNAINKFYKKILKNFKNKVSLSEENFLIEKTPTYLKLRLNTVEGLKTKTFFFRTDVKLEEILHKLGDEYKCDFSYTSERNFLNDQYDKKIISEKINTASEEFDNISRLLNITTNDEKKDFLKIVFSNVRQQEDLKLKLLHFNLCDEYQKLEEQKVKIDQIIERKINLRLIILLLILIGQTALFSHMIWNVDYLGWDLVEPLTFLIGSSLFVCGLFYYVKLNKKYNSFEGIRKDITTYYQFKYYLKFNFNQNKHEKLKSQIEQIKAKLEINSLKY